MSEETLIDQLSEAVRGFDGQGLDAAFAEAKKCGLSPYEITKALTAGLEAARMELKSHATAIPEFLLSVDIMNYGLQRAYALIPADNAGAEPKNVVIGVVEGDVHDLGKNIIAGVLKACGYNVIDIGRNVEIASFVEQAKTNDASLLALSCMMSTAIANMRSIITWSRRFLPDVPIIVGGAALDESVAASIGADGYAESAVTAPDEAQRLLGV